jgi:exosortase
MSKTAPNGPRLAVTGRRKAERKLESKPKASEAAPTDDTKSDLALRLVAGGLVIFAGIYAYWPTLVDMVHAWEREPDYSHGYLVLPAALFFLWTRRASRPAAGAPGWVTGISLVAASLLIRLFAAVYYLESIDGWSMLLWLAGVVALLFGHAVLRWALPSIAFLVFMVPLPFRIEGMLSLPLQRIATKASCWTLQLFGQPAISEGNTIIIGDHRLEVEQACSGLRLFVSILALAFAYLILVKRTWWEKALLLASVVPIAIVANSARIVVTGLLYEYASTDSAKKFSHDFAGWAMIPLAAALFGFVLWYLSKLFREQEQLKLSEVIRRVEV